MKTWKVKYEHVEDRQTRHPFFKREETIEAETRKEAIETVKARFAPPRYDRFTASPIH